MDAPFSSRFRSGFASVEVDETKHGGASGPVGLGPAGWRLRARPVNRAASGQAAAKASRTREAVSVTRAAILIRRSRRVVNSAVASGCSWGMASRRAALYRRATGGLVAAAGALRMGDLPAAVRGAVKDDDIVELLPP